MSNPSTTDDQILAAIPSISTVGADATSDDPRTSEHPISAPEDQSDEDEDVVDLTGPAKRRRSKADREAKKGGKAGNQGRFHGEQLAFLEEGVAAYIACPQKRGAERNAALTRFWADIMPSFWERFSWIDVREELAKERGKHVLSWTRAQIIDSTKDSIISWYRYRNKNAHAANANPWKPMISALRTPQMRAPRMLPAWQIWMSDHGDEINTVADLKKADGKTTGVAERNTIARELFELEDVSVKAQYTTKAQERFAEETERRQSDILGEPSDDPEIQMRARQRLSSVVTPLLQAIGAYTGFKAITLIGGMLVADGECTVGAVNWGATNEAVPRSFSTFDPDGFDNVVGQFTKFLYAVSGESNTSDLTNAKIVHVVPAEETVAQPISVDQEAAPRARASRKDKGVGKGATPRNKRPAKTVEKNGSSKGSAEKVDEEELTLTPHANASVVRKVAAMSEAERRKEIREINSLDSFELTRYNNIAYLKELEQQLELGIGPWDTQDQDKSLPASTSSPRSSPAPIQPALSRAHSNDAPDPPDSSVPPSSPTTSEVIVEQLPDPLQTLSSPLHPPENPATPGVPSTPADSGDLPGSENAQQRGTLDAIEFDKTSWPGWMEELYTRFAGEKVGEAHEKEWGDLMRHWVVLEEALEFKQPKVGLPAGQRPADISWWIKKARDGRVIVKNASKFAKEWDNWWNKINPEWRTRENNELVRGKTGETGDWTPAWVSGTNGFINVIAGLVALRDVLGVEEWEERMRDVSWVLKEAGLSKKLSLKRSSEETSPETPENAPPAPKRRRV